MFWLPTIKKQTNTAFFCPRLNVLGCEKNKLKNRLSGGNCNRVVLPNLQRYQDGKLQVSVYDSTEGCRTMRLHRRVPYYETPLKRAVLWDSSWTVATFKFNVALRPQRQSSGAVWRSRWSSWAPVPNKRDGVCGRKATLKRNVHRDHKDCYGRGAQEGHLDFHQRLFTKDFHQRLFSLLSHSSWILKSGRMVTSSSFSE